MSQQDPKPTARKPRYGDELELDVLAYDRRGLSVGTSGEYDLRMRGGAPGDRWRVSVIRRRRSVLDVRGVELLTAGPARAEPRCEHHASCGGCSFQECSYAEQLVQKHRHVSEALRDVPMPAGVVVEPVLGCGEPWAYRNKMEFSFGSRRWVEHDEPEGAESGFALGLHAPGRFDKVLHLAECRIVFAEGEALLKSAGRLAREQGLSPWDVRAHTGFLRHLVVRHGVNTGEVMANVVTSSESPELFGPFAEALLAAHPELTTLVQTLNTGVASVAYGERELVIHGPGYIEEELLGLRFRISARSFFQVNTRQAEHLFELVRSEAAPTGEEVIYDLYSGAGTIGLLLAPKAREVHAFEEVPEAVEDARRNAELNGVENIHFYQGDVLTALDDAIGEAPSLPRPDVVVVDPPRAGLHPKVPGKLLELGAQRLVYVSCNIHNGASDIATLVAGGYAVQRVVPVDLFPHTPHVECVVTLQRSA